MNTSRVLDIMSGREQSLTSRLARAALSVLEKPYRAVVAVRNATFDGKLRRPRPMGRVTISVGNLTTGGTGKTPMVSEIVRRLKRAGAAPAVLLRGYKQANGRSDEELVLAESLGAEVPVVAAPYRIQGAKRALERNPRVDVFVLDDGFQHRQVHRDLDLVLIDATQPFGFEHVLPRGLLREPPESLRRADGIVITRADQVTSDRRYLLDHRIEQLTGRPPMAHAAHEWEAFYDARDCPHALDILAHAKVAAACAVGNPQSFLAMLRSRVGAIVSEHLFPDHYAYSRRDIEMIFKEAVRCGAEAVVMTEKDWVKWMPWIEPDHLPLPIYHPKLHLRILDGEEALDGLLDAVLKKRSNPV